MNTKNLYDVSNFVDHTLKACPPVISILVCGESVSPTIEIHVNLMRNDVIRRTVI